MRSLAPPFAAGTSLVTLGFSAAIGQAVLVREGMAALGGSELAWGAVLALWLGGMGIGAWIGTRKGGRRLAAAAPTAVAALTVLAVALFRAAPALTGAAPGEAPTAWGGMWVWALAVGGPAVVGGWSFPVAATSLRGSAAAAAYALESAGAAAGGLVFTFLLATHGSWTAASAACGVALSGWLLSRGRVWAVPLPLVAAAVLAQPGERLLAAEGWRWSGREGRLAAWAETREQRLELADGPSMALYADGRLVASAPDPYRASARAHMALLLCPHPGRVLLVGGIADGTVAAMLREPGVRVTVVEEDAGLARVLPRWIGGAAAALADPRVRAAIGDPLRVVRRDGPWDEIVLFDGDPTTLRRDRTRTVEFFQACAASLSPGGVLVVRVGVGDTYVGGAGGRLLAIIASTLRSAFPRVTALPGEEVLLAAGQDAAGLTVDPAVLEARWREKGAHDPEFSSEMIPIFADPGRASALAAFLEAHPAPVNRVRHPRAVLLAAALHEARGSPPLLTVARTVEAAPFAPLVVCLVAVIGLLLARAAGGARLAAEAGAVVGFASMTWWLLLLASWQATMGSVYAEIGALSAAFMAGLLAGTAVARRHRHVGPVPLAWVLAAGSVLSLLCAAGLPLAAARATVVPLLLVAGALTGAAFPSVASLAGRAEVRRGAGIGFGADEAGAAVAALTVGLLVLPLAGLAAVGLGLAGLQLATAAALALAARRRGEGSVAPSRG